MLISIAVLCLVFALVASTAAPVHADNNLWPIEREIIAQTNAERAKYGLPPLEADQKLVESARQQAYWMTNNRTLTHTSQAVGENIAMGQRTTAEAVRDWMNSSGHRANILRSSYTKMGAGAFVAPDGTIYWCQQFLW